MAAAGLCTKFEKPAYRLPTKPQTKRHATSRPAL
jgi:hypothetical protein